MTQRGRVAVLLVPVALASLIAGSEWHPVFGWDAIAVKMAVAAVVPVLIVGVTGRRHPWPLWQSGLLSAVALYWFLAVVVLRDSVAGFLPSAQSPEDVYRGIVSGWSEILSVPIQVTGPLGMLIFPCALVWVASLIGAEMVRRSHPTMWAIAPATVALVAALPFGVGGAGPLLLPAILLVAVALVFAAMTAQPAVEAARGQDSSGMLRRVLATAGAGVGVVVVAVGLGPSLPGIAAGRPYDPRANRVEPTTQVQAINPLDDLSAWAIQPPTLLFTVKASEAEPIRLAVLSQYDDNNGWSDLSTFEQIGHTVPGSDGQPPVVGKGDTVVTQNITVASLPGPWLPAYERPISITGASVLASISTGILAASSSVSHQVSYTVRSEVPSGALSCTYADVARVPLVAVQSAQVEQLATSLTKGDLTPCAKARSLEAALKDPSQFTLDPKAPSGTNIHVMSDFLGTTARTGGTSEQFASAFALMAESLGLPTRVVMGFHLGQPSAPGVYPVTTKDAFAWDEVDFAGVGWVPFFPTPNTGGNANHPDQQSQTPSNSNGGGKTNPVPAPIAVQGPLAPPVPKGLSTLLMAGIVAGITVGTTLVVVSVLAFAVALVRRRRQRRRRQAELARDRVLGAWLHSVDVMGELGVPIRGSQTAEEFVVVGSRNLAEHDEGQLQPLAVMVNSVSFSDADPDDEVADQAWECADAVSLGVRAAMNRRRRLLRLVDPRALRRRPR